MTPSQTLTRPELPAGGPELLSAPRATRPLSLGERILVATDSSNASDAALAVGDALARREGLPMSLLTVFEPLPLPAEGIPITAYYEASDRDRRKRLVEYVTLQARKVLGDDNAYPIDVRDGEPASVIVRASRRAPTPFIIMGLGRHEAVERYLGPETALRTIRQSRVPVLAVAPTCSALPMSALVALDGSLSSRRAARIALELLGGRGTLFLAYVAPRLEIPFAGSASEGEFYGQPSDVLTTAQAELAATPGVTLRPTILRGSPARELLAFARDNAIDLIAAGTHGRSFVSRVLLGSVSTRLIRGASCSVVIAPPEAED